MSSLLLVGCFEQASSLSSAPIRLVFKPTLPTKDDVAVVDGRPITITAFLSLRSELHRLSKEDVLWIALCSMGLQAYSQEKGKALSSIQAIALSKYAFGLTPWSDVSDLKNYPLPFTLEENRPIKGDLNQFLAQLVVQKNPQALAEIH